MRSSTLLLVMLGSLLALATPAAKGSEFGRRAKLSKLRCVHIDNHIVYPLDVTDRIDVGQFRCTAAVTNKEKEPKTFKVSLRLDQADSEQGGKGVHAEANQDVSLGTGSANDVEITLDMPQELNGCVPYTLTFAVGTRFLKKEMDPNCPD